MPSVLFVWPEHVFGYSPVQLVLPVCLVSGAAVWVDRCVGVWDGSVCVCCCALTSLERFSRQT